MHIVSSWLSSVLFVAVGMVSVGVLLLDIPYQPKVLRLDVNPVTINNVSKKTCLYESDIIFIVGDYL